MWALTRRLTSILLGCDRKMLRYIAGVTWRDQVTFAEGSRQTLNTTSPMRTHGIFLLWCGTCHMAYILTFYIFLPSLNNNTIFIFSSYFIKHTLASLFKLCICATKSLHLGI